MSNTPHREVTNHKTPGNPVNEQLTITVLDEQGPGGANHEYLVAGPSFGYRIGFQNGPIKEAGVNGVTQEALIAVCIDRLRGFQNGDFACRENAIALTKLEEALMWLQSRTLARVKRGVEGTNQP